MSRGTGRMSSDATLTRPGYIWNTRTYSWDKDPNYTGPDLKDLKEGFGLSKIKKKPKEEKGVLMTNKASRNNLKIRKKQGKRKFRVKSSFVGGMGDSSNIGLS